MNDKIEDSPDCRLENARNRRRLANILNNLLDEALKGKLRCAARKNGDAGNGPGNEIHVYYNDCMVIIRIHDFL